MLKLENQNLENFYERMVYVADQIERFERNPSNRPADIQRAMQTASIPEQFEVYLNNVLPLRRLQKTGMLTDDFRDPDNRQEIKNSALHITKL